MEKQTVTKLKKNDIVQVIAGKHKGEKGKILEISNTDGKVLVEGINVIKKTIKKSEKNPKGGIISKEAFFDISNVMFFDSKANKPSRLGYKMENEKKVRYSKKSNSIIE